MRVGLGLGLGFASGGAAAWSPSVLPLAGWWRSTNGTDTVVNGHALTTWTDLSASIVATQAVAGAKPTFATGGVQGLPCIRFPVSADRQLVAAAFAQENQPYEIYVVCVTNSTTAGTVVDRPNGNRGRVFISTHWKIFSGAQVANTSGTIGETSILDAFFGGVDSYIYNLDDGGFGDCGASNPAGAGLSIGAFWTGSDGFYGDIYEIVACTRVLDEAEVLSLYAYLNARYGTSA